MNKKKLLTALATVGPLLLWAGAAMAANSGVGVIDTWSNQFAHIAQAGGYAATGLGLLGVLHHVHTGSWSGGLSHVGLAFVGGDILMNYATVGAQFGGVAGALIHPSTHAIITHPATHHLLHGASRLVS